MKQTIILLYGGRSAEREVSVLSAERTETSRSALRPPYKRIIVCFILLVLILIEYSLFSISYLLLFLKLEPDTSLQEI